MNHVMLAIAFNIIFLLMPFGLFSQDLSYQRVSATNNAIYALSDDVIIIAGRDGKLIKTTDGGVNWYWRETNTRNSFHSLEFNKDKIGFSATDKEIFLTNDEGETWDMIYHTNDSISKASFYDEDHIIFAQNNNIMSLDINTRETEILIKTDYKILKYSRDNDKLYMITGDHYYKYKDYELVYEQKFTGKYDLTLTNIAAKDDIVILIGHDAKIRNDTVIAGSRFAFISRNGGESFDTLGPEHNSPSIIVNIPGGFISYFAPGVIEQLNPDYETIKYDTVNTKNYMRAKLARCLLMDLKYINDKIYFCGRDEVWGYMIPGGEPILKNWAILDYFGGIYVDLHNIVFIGDDILAYGTLGNILMSHDNGIVWNKIFPVDSVSEYGINSKWFKYTDLSSCFYCHFRYKNGFRFIGSIHGGQNLDIYLDTTSMEFTDLHELKLYGIARNEDHLVGRSADKILFSLDNGLTWDSYKLDNGNSVIGITPGKSKNDFTLLLYEYLDLKDTINNPNKEISVAKVMSFDPVKKELNEKYRVYFSVASFTKLDKTVDGKYLLYGNRKYIYTLDDSFNKVKEVKVDFYPEYIYQNNEHDWIALSNSDSLLITTDSGKSWETFLIGPGINGPIDDRSTRLYKIKPLREKNEYLVVGGNRIVKVKIDFTTGVVEDLAVENSPIPIIIYPPYPNPVGKMLNIKLLWDRYRITKTDFIITLYDLSGIKVREFPTNNMTSLSSNYAIFHCNVSNVHSGMYYLQIKTKKYSKAVPVLISR